MMQLMCFGFRISGYMPVYVAGRESKSTDDFMLDTVCHSPHLTPLFLEPSEAITL